MTADYTVVEVVEGEVGQELQLTASATWPRQPAGVARAAGTVTSISVDGGRPVAPGDVLYTVDLRPVVAAQGSVPAFRDLAAGVRGPDVEQVQQLLQATGHLRQDPDGIFGTATTNAVRGWQKALGITPDGVVKAGDVLFLPNLPSRIVPDPEVLSVGASLSGGEATVQLLAAEPVFVLQVTEEQSSRIPSGSPVLVDAPDGTQWEATVTQDPRPTTDEGVVSVALSGAEAASPLCGGACNAIPTAGDSQLQSTVVTVPSEQGLTLPAAAVRTDATGAPYVLDAMGERRPLTVGVGVAGTVLIHGLQAGQRVRVPSTTGT